MGGLRYTFLMKAKIFLVDDEAEIRSMVGEYLSAHGFLVSTAGSCGEALSRLKVESPDLVLLDIMLPDGDGFTLFERLRERDPALPILFLSAKDEDSDRLYGLGLGADDYLTKPFLLKELLLRIQAILRRTRKEPEENASVFSLGEITIDLKSASVRRSDGEELTLTAKEYTLLKKLYDNRGCIVTLDALCEALWDGELFGYENTLMVHIRRLREKIEENPSAPRYLLTVRGLGYKLVRAK